MKRVLARNYVPRFCKDSLGKEQLQEVQLAKVSGYKVINKLHGHLLLRE